MKKTLIFAATFAFYLSSMAMGAEAPPAARSPEEGEAFAAFDAALKEGQFDQCEALLIGLRHDYPQAPLVAKAETDMAAVLVGHGKYFEALTALKPFLVGGEYAGLHPGYTITARVWYARAAARSGERNQAREILLTLLNPDNPSSVIRAHDTLRQEKLIGGMTAEDLEAWKLAFQAIEIGESTTEQMKKMATERLFTLNAETAGYPNVVLLRALEDKYEEWKGLQAQHKLERAAEVFPEVDAACKAYETAVFTAEAEGTLDALEHLLTALHIRGGILQDQGNFKAARDVFARASEYKDDPRLKRPLLIAQSRLCEIMCKNSLGQSMDQTQQELLELLEDPSMGSGETVLAYDTLAQLAERRDDIEAAYHYRREIVTSTNEPMLAVSTATRMQRMEDMHPELKTAAESFGPTDAWAALERAGRVRADAQGNLKIQKVNTARPFAAPAATSAPAATPAPAE